MPSMHEPGNREDRERLSRDVRRAACGGVEMGRHEGANILAGVGHRDAITVLCDFALTAQRRDRLAEVLSVGYE